MPSLRVCGLREGASANINLKTNKHNEEQAKNTCSIVVCRHLVGCQRPGEDRHIQSRAQLGYFTDHSSAKYPFCISRAGVAVNYTPWLRQLVNDMDLAYLAGYYRIGDYSAVSASLRYFSLGEVMTSQDAGAMTVNPYEMSIDVAYSLMLSEKFSLAAAVRWIYSDLTYDYTDDTTPGSAFGADLAFYYNNYIMLFIMSLMILLILILML